MCENRVSATGGHEGGSPPGSRLHVGPSAWAPRAKVVAVSRFPDVDSAPDVGRLVSYLDGTDRGLSPMKSYMAAAAALHVPAGVVLDIGCGMGRDLVRLDALGLAAIGIDASMSMLATARSRFRLPLVQGDAARLPLRAGSLDGCRIERVLQHVISPKAVVDEIARVVRPGGFIAAFDTDFRRYTVETDDEALADLPGAVMRARHPGVGGDLAALMAEAGFEIRNIVTELSHTSSFDRMPTDVRGSMARAVMEGVLERATADWWIAEQERRTAAGNFRATWVKVLVTGTRSVVCRRA